MLQRQRQDAAAAELRRHSDGVGVHDRSLQQRLQDAKAKSARRPKRRRLDTSAAATEQHRCGGVESPARRRRRSGDAQIDAPTSKNIVLPSFFFQFELSASSTRRDRATGARRGALSGKASRRRGDRQQRQVGVVLGDQLGWLCLFLLFFVIERDRRPRTHVTIK